MDDFRSRSCSNGKTQMDLYTIPPPNPKPKIDFRSYSTSSSHHQQQKQHQQQQLENRDLKFNKVKSTNGSSSSSSSSTSSYASKAWSFTDPELQRKKRVVSYKVYVVEGKLKGSISKSFKWIKDRYTQAVHGWR